jgi:hypothetical protein
MERHTPCARGPHGPIAQTDGRFWAVGYLFVGFMVAAGFGLLHREQLQVRRRSVDARRRTTTDRGRVTS